MTAPVSILQELGMLFREQLRSQFKNVKVRIEYIITGAPPIGAPHRVLVLASNTCRAYAPVIARVPGMHSQSVTMS